MEYVKTRVTDGTSKRQVEIPRFASPSVSTWQKDMLSLCGLGQQGVSEEEAIKRAISLFTGNRSVKFQHYVKNSRSVTLPECPAADLPKFSAEVVKEAEAWLYVAKPRSAISKPKKPPKTSKVVFSAAPSQEELQSIIAAAQAKLAEAKKA